MTAHEARCPACNRTILLRALPARVVCLCGASLLAGQTSPSSAGQRTWVVRAAEQTIEDARREADAEEEP